MANTKAWYDSPPLPMKIVVIKLFVVSIFGTLTHILARKDNREWFPYCLLSQDPSLANLHSDLYLHFHPKAAFRFSVHCRRGLGPPTSDYQLVLSRQVLVPQRWFTPQEKALDERILLNPVTSYSDKNYADDGAKTANNAP